MLASQSGVGGSADGSGMPSGVPLIRALRPMERLSVSRIVRTSWLLRAITILAVGAPMLLACSTPAPVGGTTPTREPTAVPSLPPVVATARPLDPIADSVCNEYLGLVVSTATQSVEAALNSYRCAGLYVDSTGRYPPADSPLVILPGEPLKLRVDNAAGEVPSEVEIRLYSGAGVTGAFLRWPEDYLVGVRPVDSATPSPTPSIAYFPQAPPGAYSLVIRVAWEGPIHVFYSSSFAIEPGS